MANLKISQLPAAGALTGAELVEAVQGGINVQTTITDVVALAGGGGHVIEDEGTPLTQRTKLNFVGAGVTVTDDGGDDASVVTISGSTSNLVVEAVAINTGTLTLDLDSEDTKRFDLTSTVSSGFTIALSNTSNVVEFGLTMRVTGAVAITMPSAVKMMRSESTAGRWVPGSPGVLTTTGVTASPFRLWFTFDGTNYLCEASDYYE